MRTRSNTTTRRIPGCPVADFKRHIEPLIVKEGGYTDHTVKGDRGGRTYAGIASASNPDWPGWQYLDSGQHPPKELVHQIYKRKYWDSMRLDDIPNEIVASVLFSSCVLSGPATATRLAQTVADARVDGAMGPNTVRAVNGVDPEKFVLAFSLARIARFSRIVMKNPAQRKFFLGWCNRVLNEAAEAADMGG